MLTELLDGTYAKSARYLRKEVEAQRELGR